MKVELNDLRLAVTALTKNVQVGIPEKDNISFRHQKDVTSDFNKALLEKYGGHEVEINAPESVNGKPPGKWKIRVEYVEPSLSDTRHIAHNAVAEFQQKRDTVRE